MANDKNLILVASDDPNIRELVKTAAQNESLETTLCGDGLEAVESIKESTVTVSNYKCVVLEAFLPKIDGYEVIKQFQEIPLIKETPVLMLIGKSGSAFSRYQSGAGEPKTVQTKIRLLADNYLQKPFTLQEIQSEIHSMVKHFRKHNGPHPVTGLGGHPQMEQEVISRLSKGETFTTLWIDINHFRPFNDHTSAQKGDEVLKVVMELIQKVLKENQGADPLKPFLAHVGGDDFILLVSKEAADKIKSCLREEFSKTILKFYSKDEQDKGFFYEKGRDQTDQIFPLMNLSMAVLDVSMEKFLHYGHLVSESNELLSQTKIGAQDVK
ncbi:MAG: hypothetical protein A3I11_09215 [Elusimicrobia bacterium RIFCSPLOWO2_02_FULL_39_32]|nr:MAG: hypothetical protein A2034_02915 [Elusimicrobia bacterium GWA2_38_7]OGR79915.1 MAG: hypothetical protein A3B80_01285 [Elusimicrobia bacterium RIFCSPHIGHO2_02_FULL_39_36]OGR93450.1 MAG: hypothetical protein A3I11_09215 [Elusimicrobia bacterium RIFCSPLOWO2_02_FULL_39_32]OGS00297.1 MAG: hypothetical protein A3G85_05655 [Elusimicrobia bacterium RIFCSPLOWO2_12_FULL_39_28]